MAWIILLVLFRWTDVEYVYRIETKLSPWTLFLAKKDTLANSPHLSYLQVGQSRPAEHSFWFIMSVRRQDSCISSLVDLAAFSNIHTREHSDAHGCGFGHRGGKKDEHTQETFPPSGGWDTEPFGPNYALEGIVAWVKNVIIAMIHFQDIVHRGYIMGTGHRGMKCEIVCKDDLEVQRCANKASRKMWSFCV